MTDQEHTQSETGLYILRPLVKVAALGAEARGNGDGPEQSIQIKITCVDVWGENLYIGTTAGEIFHYVQVPPPQPLPGIAYGQPVFTLASRIKPPVNRPGAEGIQQILLLPSTKKACILCNGTLNFYVLPELSPAFPQQDPLTCSWVGGVDRDTDEESGPDAVVIMMCLRTKIRLVKVGAQLMRIRDIAFPGCLSMVCRGGIVCVADAKTYALLDLAHRQKIQLFAISSVNNEPTENAETGPIPHEVLLKPLIESPDSGSFLLVMGTHPLEPGIGMLVSLDGEITRGTIQFASYPTSLVVDGKGVKVPSLPMPGAVEEEGYILAVVHRKVDGTLTLDVEIHRWDIDPGGEAARKEWLGIFPRVSNVTDALDIRQTVAPVEISLPEIADKLALKPIQLRGPNGKSSITGRIEREKEERDFVSDLCKVDARITLWIQDEVFWILRNPMLLRLDARLGIAHSTSVAPRAIQIIINEIRGLKSQTALEFFTLRYVRQKAALLLFTDLISRTASGVFVTDHDKLAVEEILIESEVDPRIVLAFLPIRDEIQCGPDGVWIQAGLKAHLDRFLARKDFTNMPMDPVGSYGNNILHLVRRLLISWRQKKGNPSVTDSSHVFATVDSALIHTLLLLDNNTPRGRATVGSLRAELNSIIDSGVEDYERAIVLLEKFKRLYLLSRLFQSRKQDAQVLEVWRRILNGEEDSGGEFIDGEQEFRIFLSNVGDRQLVEEYGLWLAERNPVLGVQVFVDDNGKTKWEPANTLELLRRRAPSAVKEYLEQQVFSKRQPQFINDLMTYYLDIVLSGLSTSAHTRIALASTIEAYKALRPPKPAYFQFISDSTTSSDEWQRSRNRLLQLLSANQNAASSYNVRTILKRLEPFKSQLIPEIVILYGRQGRHEEAIRLLTHDLSDFNTAIAYCLSSGNSVFKEPMDAIGSKARPKTEAQQRLFIMLLEEFLRIEDLSDSIECTHELLSRFEASLDIFQVLPLLPSSWSIEIFSSFLISALRRHVREQHESSMLKALSGVENIIASLEIIKKEEERGFSVDLAPNSLDE